MSAVASAPAPAASPAASPAPAAAPAAPAAAPQSGRQAANLSDAYSMLDAMGKPDDAAPSTPPKPSDPTPPKPGEPDSAAAKPGDDPNRLAPRQLRAAYEDLKRKHTELQRQRDEEAAKPITDRPEFKKLHETLAQREQRLAELEDEVKFANYERSSEYIHKYKQPLNEAYAAGCEKVAGVRVVGQDGQTRQGTAHDFDVIMQQTDDSAAANMATEMFGPAAAMVLFHRERVLELNNRQMRAIEQFKQQGGQREAQRGEMQSRQAQAQAQAWSKANETAIKKYPHLFAPDPEDSKGNEILEKGFELADAAFSGGNIRDPKTGQFRRLTQQEQILLHSAVRNKAAAFDRLAYRLNQTKARVKELESKLKSFQDSEPGAGSGKGKPGAQLSTWDQIDADLLKRAH